SAQSRRIGSAQIVPTGAVTPPRVVSYTYPSFTNEARSRNVEGFVTLEAGFDITGSFRVLRIAKSLGFGLDERALAVLPEWRFLPALQNGSPTAVIAQIDVEFKR